MEHLIDKLRRERRLEAAEYASVLEAGGDVADYAAKLAHEEAVERFGRGVYVRGLIEATSYCRNDCYYCGLRRSNPHAERYRLDTEQIMEACRSGYSLGFKTFVIQGGEDPAFGDAWLVPLVQGLRHQFPDCAITLSLGERSRESYRRLREAGADRYLLRHEAADPGHYTALHPAQMSHARRMECLDTLRQMGYQTGAGMMVGTPGQRTEHLVADLLFLQQFRPEMVGIGPFIPHTDTPFASHCAGDVDLTLLLLSLVRLMLPDALIPATTALATASQDGRERGLLAGANVVMPNLSPADVRRKYAIYNNKASLGAEAAEGLRLLADRLAAIGYHIDFSRGDFHPHTH